MRCSSVAAVARVRTEFTWLENAPLPCEKEREMYMSEHGEIEGCYREAFQSFWGCEMKAIEVLEGRNWLL